MRLYARIHHIHARIHVAEVGNEDEKKWKKNSNLAFTQCMRSVCVCVERAECGVSFIWRMWRGISFTFRPICHSTIIIASKIRTCMEGTWISVGEEWGTRKKLLFTLTFISEKIKFKWPNYETKKAYKLTPYYWIVPIHFIFGSYFLAASLVLPLSDDDDGDDDGVML